MMASPLDPRVRMRDALRTLVDESPARWDAPSLFVLRNRLLDHTGSDARPLAEFLIEALRRGWRDRLPSGAVDTGRFDAMVAPFVLQWSRERFVQPEMARWAVESWAYALRVIDESQVRVAPPPKLPPLGRTSSHWPRRTARLRGCLHPTKPTSIPFGHCPIPRPDPPPHRLAPAG